MIEFSDLEITDIIKAELLPLKTEEVEAISVEFTTPTKANSFPSSFTFGLAKLTAETVLTSIPKEVATDSKLESCIFEEIRSYCLSLVTNKETKSLTSSKLFGPCSCIADKQTTT